MTNTTTTKSTTRSQPQRLEEGKDLVKLAKALAGAKTPEARDKAMIAMREAGANYAQIAQAMGVVPMTARSRVLKARQ